MCWIKLAYLAPTVNYSPRQFGYCSQYIISTSTILFFSYRSNYQNSVDVSRASLHYIKQLTLLILLPCEAFIILLLPS